MKPKIRLRNRQRTITRNVLIAAAAIVGISFLTVGLIFFFNVGDVRKTKGAAIVSAIANGNWTDGSIWSSGTAPSNLDAVVIDDGFAVVLDADASCISLTITAPISNGTTQLIITVNRELTITSNVALNGGTNNKRDANIVFNDGAKLTVLGDFIVNSASFRRVKLDMMGQNAILNLEGAFAINSAVRIRGGTVNFNGLDPQVFPASAGVKFRNVQFNNTSTEGVRIDADITRFIVSGHLKVQSGVFDNGGFDISGNNGKIFEVAAGAQFILKESSDFPTVYNVVLDENSTVKYLGTSDQTIAARRYGNLVLGNTGTKTFPAGGAIEIAGDLTCRSATTVSSNSTVLFNGRFPQYLLGDSTIRFDKLRLDNIRGLVLNHRVIVDNLLTLISGNISTSLLDILIFNPLASATGGSDSSYINGPAIKITTSANSFTFPLGKANSYRPMAVEPTGSSATTFIAEYFNASYQNTSSLGAGLDHVSAIDYFQVDKVGSTDAKIGLSWDGTTAVQNAYIQDLRVAKWNGTSWMDMGNTSVMGDSMAGLVMSDVVTSFSPFTIGSISKFNPLPIELMSFKAATEGKSVILTWETATESNNDFFTIEKSEDARSFHEIERVEGAGTSNRPLKYQTTDDNPLSGISYYRLKQTDYDGQFKYVKVVAVEFYNEIVPETISLAPNPFSSHFNLDFTLNKNERVDLSIISIDGQIMHRELIEALIGVNHFNYSDGDHLSKGVYFVNVLGDNTSLGVKAVKL